MKPLVIALSASLAANACAQSFSVDWFTVDGGGGESTNRAYTVTGTVGQSDAGVVMTNGQYTLTGGFWLLATMRTEGAPILSITRTPTNTVVVFWSSVSTNWILQQNTLLPSTNWTAISEPITDDGSSKFIIVSPVVGNRFYRLFRP